MPNELDRYKGQFVQGAPKQIKPPKEPAIKQFDTKVSVHLNSLSHNGWIHLKEGLHKIIIIKRQKKNETEQQTLCDYDSHCPNCDIDIINGQEPLAHFCPDCGSELLQPFYCLICHTPMSGTSKYCPACGMKAIRY